MNKKAKHIYKKYVQFMNDLSRRSVKLSLPNDTRAAGVVLMYRSLIKSRFNLKQYYYNHDVPKKLSDEDFVTIAELEAVLYPLALLIKLL
jgi:hypothetical protein